MPDVISDTNGKLCVGSYHMWRLLSNPDNYSFSCQSIPAFHHILSVAADFFSKVCLQAQIEVQPQ